MVVGLRLACESNPPSLIILHFFLAFFPSVFQNNFDRDPNHHFTRSGTMRMVDAGSKSITASSHCCCDLLRLASNMQKVLEAKLKAGLEALPQNVFFSNLRGQRTSASPGLRHQVFDVFKRWNSNVRLLRGTRPVMQPSTKSGKEGGKAERRKGGEAGSFVHLSPGEGKVGGAVDEHRLQLCGAHRCFRGRRRCAGELGRGDVGRVEGYLQAERPLFLLRFDCTRMLT